MIPAMAPVLASCGEAAVSITTPKAMEEGKATSIAARPPQKSPTAGKIRFVTTLLETRNQKLEPEIVLLVSGF
jgi:hypothetical protein